MNKIEAISNEGELFSSLKVFQDNPELAQRFLLLYENLWHFEELFFLQLKLIKLKKLNQQNIRGHVFSIVGAYFNEFYKQIPF